MTDIGQPRRNVVVTGFGLFRDHELNPSWEAIKDGQLKINRPNINIITRQIPVIYQEVDKAVEELWTSYEPILMVHVGLAAHETSIRLEQVARHGPYIHDDVIHQAPHEDHRLYDGDSHSLEENIKRHYYTCKPCNFSFSETCFDVEHVCRKLDALHRQGEVPLPFKCSKEAGLYVCEYLYQKSLRICNRCVFIHVPDTKNYRLEDIRECVKTAIELFIDEMERVK